MPYESIVKMLGKQLRNMLNMLLKVKWFEVHKYMRHINLSRIGYKIHFHLTLQLLLFKKTNMQHALTYAT